MINKCHLWSYWIIKVTLLNKIIMTMIFGYNQVANIFNMNIWSLTAKLFIGLWKFQDKAVCFCCLQWWFRSEVWSTDITEQHGAVWGGSITLCCCHLTCNASDVQPGQWCHCCWVNHSRKKKKKNGAAGDLQMDAKSNLQCCECGDIEQNTSLKSLI